MKELWGEEEHGLGINRKVAADKVFAFEDGNSAGSTNVGIVGRKPKKVSRPVRGRRGHAPFHSTKSRR